MTRDAKLADLEAALAAAWDRDTLAVYADELLSRGDPRGELIAIDLEIAEHGSTAELASRRTSILHGWLGGHVPMNPHRPWIGESLQLGFVDDLCIDEQGALTVDDVRLALATPLAPYLRGVTVIGDARSIARTLRELAVREHGHLQRLTISARDGGLVDDGAVRALLAACPRLQLLEVRGNQVLRDLPHPTLRRARITGFDAIVALADGTGDAWPAVEELDFAFGDALADYGRRIPVVALPAGEPPTLLAAEMLPALRRLDLSRNEHDVLVPNAYDIYDDLEGDPDDAIVTENVELFAWLRELPVRSQLSHLRVPSVRTDIDARWLQDALDGMPALEELVIARGHYARLPPLRHPRAQISIPPAWPWPPPRDVRAAALRITVSRSRHEVDVHLAEAVTAMENHFEAMAPSAREAWTRFWDVARQVGDDRLSFPSRTLLRALEAVELESWRELRMELRAYPLADDEMVTIERATVEPWG